MSSPLVTRARRYATDAGRAVEHAPVEVVLAVITAAVLSYAIESAGVPLRAWLEVAIVAFLMAAAAWSATLLHRLNAIAPRTRWGIVLVVATLVGAYGLLLLDLERQAEGWRSLALAAAAVCAVVATPAFAPGDGTPTDRLRRVNGRFLLRVMGVLLYGAALFAGLALALAAVDTLFELDLRGTIYGHVFGWIFLVLVPWVVAGGLPAYSAPADNGDDVAGAVHRLSGFLVPPLLAVYLAILVAYSVRIAVTGELPKNLVSPMVLAAGVLGVSALLLFDPAPAARSSFRWLRGVPVAFLPLGALGVYALALRLAQYGVTEPRALRLVLLVGLMVLAALAAWQLTRRRRFALHVVPALFALMFLFVAVGPWNVQALAKRSQQQRLDEAMRRAGVTATAPVADGRGTIDVSRELYEDVRSTAQYLASHFGVAALPPALAGLASAETGYHDLAERAGLRAAPAVDGRAFFASARLPEGVRIAAPNGAEQYRVEFMRDRTWPHHAPSSGVTAMQDGTQLRVRVGAGSMVASLESVERALRAGTDARTASFSADDAVLSVVDEDGRPAGSLLLLDVTAEWQNGVFRLQRLDGILTLERRTPVAF